MKKLFDKKLRSIMMGDVVKVYHFTATRPRKKHYMYKQVVRRTFAEIDTPILYFSHLDLSDDAYPIICDDQVLQDYEIVQSMTADLEDRERRS
jgi:hypothetical protein